MELKDLKKTWQKLGSEKELDESQIRELLRKRTSTLLERIDRNVKIGFIILFLLIALFVLDDFVFSSSINEMAGTESGIPSWILVLGTISNLLILGTFIYFAIQYYRVKHICNISCNLRETLLRIIRTLQIYQCLFYLALITFSVAIAISFITGMYTGMEESAAESGMLISEIPFNKLILAFAIGLFVLILLVGGVFLLMRWGFRKLYGNYIQKLKHTLNELEEVDG